MDSEPSSPAGPRVAIVGAGLTGLLAAHGLRKHGFDVALFDAEPALDARANRDWTIVLHWALPVMQALLPAAVVARLPHAICNPFLEFDARAEAFAVFHGATGDPLFQSPMPGSRRVSRQRLRRVLAEGLDVGIQWGRTVTALTDAGNSDNSNNNNNNTANGPLRLTFADGSTYDADYVLGTDGANSRLRALLLDPDGTGDGDGDGAARARTTGSGLLFATCLVRYHDAAKVAAMTQLHPVTAAARAPTPRAS
ncbi:FAD-binding domain containing protein [Niveomyces insectorum RCEF 264]|uniref:FAD-binding domain containing protein n=1 Tax=Niveomyces insectorum RCEF 264 TaxID=1081102 RepID=A0A167USV5_9HYPO|nr:FAD-binding domain containing protein [Niveomyces insectorum RCEF 264]